ncbi:WecB/TagA/CpsF family glycosyltransferase [Clostridium ganghwense]|uniref:N-acetylglucosaminyldiphosphoundecaprenol N-acetyl-beta-D-mannosaminyltransferase n=1 Tax=Clostridium ganghwense TaxID=312089 RepID=A0ABT4CN59_9CLOT|nr:WecB/TagA/CpsF family glycosyltransferase [Clostridium ganghwense]MCY6370494.1 WecB/TagA/CpsF family glycosyltransferase [Clostridium ganghwense]
MFTKILDYKVFSGTKKQLIQYIEDFDKVNIISGNPEILYSGMENEFLHQVYTDKTSVIIPDGVGTVMASKIVKNPMKEKIAGIELMEEIVKKCEKENKSIYLLGAQEEILKECIINLLVKFPNIKIVGAHNGYFDLENCEEIVEDIKHKETYALFVAMGCPRQETFIAKYMNSLPCKIFMGVGGSFDVFAGKVNRAPKWMIKLGIEWLYRVIKEPWRIKRLICIPKFLWRVIFNTDKMENK